jgi:hypothetical protein
MIELMSKASTAGDYLVPRDVGHGGLAQELVGKFGELLEAWPRMVAAARRLRANGCRLAAAL